MSQENVESLRRGVAAFNRGDAEAYIAEANTDAEWWPASPTHSVYRGHDETRRAIASVWEAWEEFRLEESEVRDLGNAALWLGHAHARGKASDVALDQEMAIHTIYVGGKAQITRTYLSWSEAFEAVGLSE